MGQNSWGGWKVGDGKGRGGKMSDNWRELLFLMGKVCITYCTGKNVILFSS